MQTKVSRHIKFNKMDRIHLDKTIDMLVDMCNIMIEDIDVGDEFNAMTNIDIIDANSGEVIATRSELENIAMALGNLWMYIEENVDKDIEIECHEVGKIPFDADDEPIII